MLEEGAPMARIRNARGELIRPTEVSASDAKNSFGRILERVAKDGAVTITRRREPLAVVIPIETYLRLANSEARMLNTLSAEFDAVLARMQMPGAAEAMQTAFAMAPAELGRAAVEMAARRDAPSRRAKAASRRRRVTKARG
jgi:prevent-host-death family protein